MRAVDSNIEAVHAVLALWGHILDDRDWDRLDECLTSDAAYDGAVFGFPRLTGIDAIRSMLAEGEHALAHHVTNVVVGDGPGAELRVRSKGIGVMAGGTVSSVSYADRLVPTPSGWRIAERVISV